MAGEIALALGAAGMGVAASVGNILNNINKGLEPPEYRISPRYSVSVCSPAYNERDYIHRLMQSAENQTEPIQEVVIADASEPDEGTSAVVEGFGGVVVRAEYGNVSRSRNLAIAQSVGDILIIADADVQMCNKFVESAVSELERGYVMAFPKMLFYDSFAWSMMAFPGGFLHSKTDAFRCYAIWREALEEVGGYDETCNPKYGCSEDSEFNVRVVAKYGGENIKILPYLAGSSARRMKKYGLTGSVPTFDDDVR